MTNSSKSKNWNSQIPCDYFLQIPGSKVHAFLLDAMKCEYFSQIIIPGSKVHVILLDADAVAGDVLVG
jgi:hypothetical protein